MGAVRSATPLNWWRTWSKASKCLQCSLNNDDLSSVILIQKLLRVSGYVQCFVRNCKQSDSYLRHTGQLLTTDIDEALRAWIHCISLLKKSLPFNHPPRTAASLSSINSNCLSINIPSFAVAGGFIMLQLTVKQISLAYFQRNTA